MPKPARFYTKLSVDAVKQISREILYGEIFGSWQCPENLLTVVFIPLAFTSRRELDYIKRHKLFHCFGYIRNAGKTAVNGFPIFTQCRFLSVDDFQRIQRHVGQLEVALDGVKVSR